MTRRLTIGAGAVALVALLSAVGPTGADPFTNAMDALRAGDAGTGAAMFHDLAKQGDGEAMYNLAVLYHHGVGVPQNHENALYWAWRARLLAVPKAQALIAVLSEGTAKDVRATLHARLMAEVQANAAKEAPSSFLRLALIETGLAAKPDKVQVYVWYSLAAAMGHKAAPSLRDMSFAALSPKEAAGAQAKALLAFGEWCGANAEDQPAVCAVLADAAARMPDNEG